MKIHDGLLVAAAVVCSISVTPAVAKTAKECTQEFIRCFTQHYTSSETDRPPFVQLIALVVRSPFRTGLSLAPCKL